MLCNYCLRKKKQVIFFSIYINSVSVMNLLLIDSRIHDIDKIESSVTKNTNCIIFDYETYTLDTIKSQIHGTYVNVGIIQHNYNDHSFRLLKSSSESILTNVSVTDNTLTTWREYIDFFEWFTTNGTQYIDLFVSNLWSDNNWRYVIYAIRNIYNVHIRASINITDDSDNFILESDNADTIGMYFLPEILFYKYVFYYVPVGNSVPNYSYSKNDNFSFSDNPYTFTGNYNSLVVDNTNSQPITLLSSNLLYATRATYKLAYSSNIADPTLRLIGYNNDDHTEMLIRIDRNGASDNKVQFYTYIYNTSPNSPAIGSFPTELTPVVSSIYYLTLTNLLRGTVYYLYIINIQSQGNDGKVYSTYLYSDTLRVKFETFPVIPTISISSTTSTTIVVTRNSTQGTGGSPITGYKYAYVINGASPPLDTSYSNPTLTTPYSISGLQRTTSYTIYVKSFNIIGSSDPAIITATTAAIAPGKPGVSISSIAATTISVTPTTPSDNGGSIITGYKYAYVITGASAPLDASYSNPTLTSPYSISGLQRTTSYTVYVKAVNGIGSSDPSNIIVTTTANTPSIPGVLISSITATTISVTSTTTDDGGRPITGYRYAYVRFEAPHPLDVSYSPRTTDSPYTIRDLQKATRYTVYVKAVNEIGSSNFATITATTDATMPGIPTILISSNTATTIGVTPTTPDNGGKPITGYKYAYVRFGEPAPLDASYSEPKSDIPYTIQYLQRTTSYTIYVKAVNEIGISEPASIPANTTANVPIKPTISTLIAATTISVTPTTTDDGGSPITGYKYAYFKNDEQPLLNNIQNISYTDVSINNIPFTIPNLSKGTTYIIYVKAVNVIGSSEPVDKYETTDTTVPGVPDISLNAKNHSIEVTVTPPQDNGGKAIIAYNITWGITENSVFTEVSNNTINVGNLNLISGKYTYTIPSLISRTTYSVFVKAKNDESGRFSERSIISDATPYTVPEKPVIQSLLEKDSSIEVTFDNSVSNGGKAITGYKYTATYSGDNSPKTGTVEFVNDKIIIPNLINGTRYSIILQAKNDDSGVFSAESVSIYATPYTVPDPPTMTLNPKDQSIEVTVTNPNSNGGKAITRYKYTATFSGDDSPKTGIVTLDASNQFIIPDLSNGTTYSVIVKAKNDESGKFSAESDNIYATPYTVPDKPSITLNPKDQSIEVTITPPYYNGGKAITGYRYKASSQGVSDKSGNILLSQNPYTIDNLSNGKNYLITLKAKNDESGKFSAESDNKYATPYTKPDPPTITLTVGDESIDVTIYPNDNGGKDITKYYIDVSNAVGYSRRVETSLNAYTVRGLSNNIEYTFRVIAENDTDREKSNPSIAKATPLPVPEKPIFFLTPGNRYIDISFNSNIPAGIDPGRLPLYYNIHITDNHISYDVSINHEPGNTNYQYITTQNTNITLVNGTPYNVSVTAVNNIGVSPYDTQTVTPCTIPDAPSELSLTPNNYSIDGSFNYPEDGGNAITSYIILVDGSNNYPTTITQQSKSVNTFTVSGLLEYRLYSISVRSVNHVGQSTTDISRSAIPYTVPDPPTGLSLESSNNLIAVSFKNPDITGGRDINGYIIQVDGSGYTPDDLSTDNDGTKRFTVKNVTIRKLYTISVKARNSVGLSNDISGTQMPYTLPNAPDNLVLEPSNNSIIGTITDSSETGGKTIIGYNIWLNESQLENVSVTTRSDGYKTFTIPDLFEHKQYTIRVNAVNEIGPSILDISRSATPFTVPGSPTDISLTPDNNSIIVVFKDPDSNGGKPIIGYNIRLNDVSLTDISVTTRLDDGSKTFTIPDLLDHKPYTIRVNAQNDVGSSNDISGSETPFTVAGEPTDITLTPSNESIIVTFRSPIDNGGKTITRYNIVSFFNDGSINVIYDPSGRLEPYTTTVDRLTNGVEYDVRINAVNSVGTSALSHVVDKVIPFTNPGPPRNLTLIPGERYIDISFQSPNTNGGRPIEKYVIHVDNSFGSIDISNNGSPNYLYRITTLIRQLYTVTVKSVHASGIACVDTPTATATPLIFPLTPVFSDPVIGNSSVQLYISNYVTDILEYSITINGNTSPIIWTKTENRPINPITIEGLTNNEENTISIRAKNVDGFSPENLIQVKPSSQYPPIPKLLWFIPGQTEIQFGMELFSGFSYYSIDGTNYNFFSIIPPDNKYIIPDLSSNTAYTIYIKTQSFNNELQSLPYVYTIKTKPPNIAVSYKPPETTVFITGKNAVQFKITPPTSGQTNIIGYQYVIGSINDLNNITYNDLVVDSDGIATINGLSVGYTYLTIVRKYLNGDVQSLFSNINNVYINNNAVIQPIISKFTFIPGYKSIQISFDETEIHSGNIRGYQYSLDNGTTFSDYIMNSSPYTVFTYPNTDNRLNANGDYNIRFRSVSNNGYYYSIWSDKIIVQLSSNIPGTPKIQSITPGDGKIQIMYIPTNENVEKVSEYQYSIDGGITFHSMGLTNPYTVDDLSNNQELRVCIRSRNNTNSVSSIPTNIKTITPQSYYGVGIPSIPSLSSQFSSIILKYTPPTSIENILYYEYSTTNGLTYNPINEDEQNPNTYTIKGLNNNELYYIRIRAVYRITVEGSTIEVYSFASDVRTIKMDITGSTPPILNNVISNDRSATIYFTAPEYTGGNGVDISNYEYSYNNDKFTPISDNDLTLVNPTNKPPSYKYTLSPLTNGQTYTIYLRAKNSSGLYSASSNSKQFIPYTIPDKPVYTITELNSSARITVLNYSSNGGNAITSYIYDVSYNNGRYQKDISFNNSFIIPDLSNGVTYSIFIIAKNAAGLSADSEKQTVIPYTVPDPPINVILTPGDRTIYISFQSPVFNGGNAITEYNIFVDPDTEETSTLNYTITNILSDPENIYTHTIPDLTPEIEYRVVVNAVNAAGSSAFSSPPVTAIPFSTPDPPRIVRITDGSGTSTVEFEDGKTNGSNLSYYYYSIDEGIWIQAYDGSFVLTGLTNGVKYGIRMKVDSDKGYSTPSDTSYCRPYTFPNKPEISTILAKNWEATINYDLGNNTGRDITDILVELNGRALVSVGVPPTLILTRLLNYNTYTIRIMSKNEAGLTSPWSDKRSFEPYYLNTELPLIKKSFTGNSSLSKAQLYAMTVRNAKGNVKNLL